MALKALKLKQQFYIQQARCKPVGHRENFLAGIILYPGVGQGILYAQQVKDLKARPYAFDVIEEAVCRPFFTFGIQQQCREAYIYTLVGRQPQYILIHMAIGRANREAAGIHAIDVHLEIFIPGQVVLKIHTKSKTLIRWQGEVIIKTRQAATVGDPLHSLKCAYADK